MANQSDALLTTEADVIQNETQQSANTAERIGTMFNDIIDSKVNNDKVSDNEALGPSTSLVPTQRAVKVYADTKEPLIGYTPENAANKSADGTFSANSDTLYPTQKATKTYADGLVVGLLNDRGNYTPSISSPGAYPSSGGSGGGGAIQKGDLWFIAADGFLGTTPVITGSSVRALVNTPGSSTDADWDILDAGLGYIPENIANKSTDDSLGNENPSNTFYPTQKAVKDYVDNAISSGLNTYKVYTASVDANSGNPTATVLENTLGVNINWSFPSNGVLRGTLNSGNFENTDKVWLSSGSYKLGSGLVYFVASRISGLNRVDFEFVFHDGTQTSTPNFINFYLEIRVYN